MALTKKERLARRSRWTRARASESLYSSRLRAVAKQVGLIVRGLAPDGRVSDPGPLLTALREYARIIEPWAKAVAAFMLMDVERRDRAMWKRNSQEMAARLREELDRTPTGTVLRQLQDDQVRLIKSIPLEAAERVHQLAAEGLISSKRANVVAKAILETEAVTEARARLIARTETSRAAANLVQARAQQAGSEGYIWRTSGDADVRDSHQEMEGKYVRWSQPPTLDNMKGHAGCLPNCRCYAEPVFPDV